MWRCTGTPSWSVRSRAPSSFHHWANRRFFARAQICALVLFSHAGSIFGRYPDLEEAYSIVHSIRIIYSNPKTTWYFLVSRNHSLETGKWFLVSSHVAIPDCLILHYVLLHKCYFVPLSLCLFHHSQVLPLCYIYRPDRTIRSAES